VARQLQENRVITILGTTASGKGALGRALAERIGSEIVSMDSMKVYRGMDIGTGKPSADVRAQTPHHLIDVVDPWESFSAARWLECADAAIADIHGRGKPAIVVGGTMLYFTCFYRGLCEGPAADEAFRAQLRQRSETEGLQALHDELLRVDPESAARIHPRDYRRIERALEVHHGSGDALTALQGQWEQAGLRRSDWRWSLIGVRYEKEIASRRTNARVKRMLDAGLVDEARRLASDARGISDQARQAVGYRELFAHFDGACSLDDAIERIKINTRRLAKHQRTWLKRMLELRWIDLAERDTVDSVLRRALGLLDAST
jgi:tRNA dimethylallyltransferase